MSLPAPECAYSFNDLFTAAQKRAMTLEERATFGALAQLERNNKVTELAQKAGWKTREVIGGDGVSYIAFCPTL